MFFLPFVLENWHAEVFNLELTYYVLQGRGGTTEELSTASDPLPYKKWDGSTPTATLHGRRVQRDFPGAPVNFCDI